ncbi:hypothetical protein AB0L59_09160 [Streptomyces sp. NPDC052109]|uniref:hypothetical protein n=1 Tax=Streptomyces sp. NPDC052109 TaxID=3155527 RepID=UPI003439F92B
MTNSAAMAVRPPDPAPRCAARPSVPGELLPREHQPRPVVRREEPSAGSGRGPEPIAEWDAEGCVRRLDRPEEEHGRAGRILVAGEDAVVPGVPRQTAARPAAPMADRFVLHRPVWGDMVVRHHVYEGSPAVERAFAPAGGSRRPA